MVEIAKNESGRRRVAEMFCHLLRSESGSAAVMVAVSLIAILGMMGLAIDVGQLRLAKQRLQLAADASSLAGALEGSLCAGTANCDMLTTAAQSALSENGLTGSTLLKNCAAGSLTSLTVTVNNGPCALGAANPHNGNTNYVEVVISQPQPTYFAGVLGISSVLIKARAEAGLGASQNCIYTLGSTGTDIQMNGSGVLSVQSCGIIDNSSNANALVMKGSGEISAASISIVGNYSKSGSGSISPKPITGVAPSSDQLAFLSPPAFAPASCLADPNLSGSAAKLLGPSIMGGTVCYNGLTIGSSGFVTLNPGLYIINGSLTLKGSGSVSGTGITFYFPPGGGSYIDSGSSTLNLSAPTSGDYDGILFYQNASDVQPISISGSSTSSINGIVYAPGANVTLNGSGTSTFYMSLVVSSINFNGSGTMTLTNYGNINPTSPLISGAQLVQ